MTTMHPPLTSMGLALLLTSTGASGQPVPPPVEDPSSEKRVGPESGPSAADQSRAPQEHSPPAKQFSVYLGSPIWLSDMPVDPGFEFEFRNGIEIGALVPELGLGMRWNWLNTGKLADLGVPRPDLYGGENLQGFWLSLGIRFEPELAGKVTPYGSAAFDFNMWGKSFDTSEVCGIWSCGTVRNYDFAPGFSGRAGVRISPKPFIGIDLGAKLGMTFQGWAFEGAHSWIEPYAGLTLITGRPKKL